jgi:hypothetical protein
MLDGRALASRTPSEQCLLDRRQEVVLALLATFISGSGFFSLEGQVITAISAALFLWIVASAIALLRSRRDTTALA